MRKDYICANALNGVGTISELSLNFTNEGDNLVRVKGNVTISINESNFLGYINITNNSKTQYYNLIKFLGLRYEFIQSIDPQPYRLSDAQVNCINGMVKINHKPVLTIQTNCTQKVYFVGRLLGEDFIMINHIIKSDCDREWLEGNIECVLGDKCVYFGVTNNEPQFIPLCLKNENLQPCVKYLIRIKDMDVEREIVDTYNVSNIKILNITDTNVKYEKDFINEQNLEFDILQKARKDRRR